MTPNTLQIENLALTYTAQRRKVYAIQDASLQVRRGEAVGIAGESGSGKSTLARAVMGLLPLGVARITQGRISILGRDVTKLSPRQWESVRGNPVAMVFQDPLSFLNPVQRISTQIKESVRRHDPDANPLQRAEELLDLVRLPGRALHRYPHELSGGMRQRVLLAIALGCRPQLLIADEPTTALDVTTQAEILALLNDLRQTLNMSLLLITHDLGVVRWNCDRLYIMYAGHTIESGRTADVLANPAHPYTKGLVDASRLERLPDGHFATIGGDVPGLNQQFSLCPFLPRCQVSMVTCNHTMPAGLSGLAGVQDARCWRFKEAVDVPEHADANP